MSPAPSTGTSPGAPQLGQEAFAPVVAIALVCAPQPRHSQRTRPTIVNSDSGSTIGAGSLKCAAVLDSCRRGATCMVSPSVIAGRAFRRRAGCGRTSVAASLPRGSARGPVGLGELRDYDGQRLRALLAEALAAHAHIELLGQGGAGQDDVHPPRLGERDAEVLDEVVDLEPRLQVALEQARPVVGQRPGARGAAGDRLKRLVEVQPGPVAIDERL